MSDNLGWQSAADTEDGATMFGAKRLNSEDASRLLAQGPGRLVVWMGERGTGKTTLCGALYEHQRHGMGDARFAGSRTLLAFEQLVHHNRASGAPPRAARTELNPEGRELLHLALGADDASLHLLLADLPGDLFRRLADNQLVASEIAWLRRADKLALLVDGAQLCDPATRSSTLVRVRQLLERLQSLPRDPDTRLALLVTKWDLVRADPDAVTYWEQREPELHEEVRALDPTAPALRVAADVGCADDGFPRLRAWLLEVALPVDEPPPPLAWTQPVALPAESESAPMLPEMFDWPVKPPSRLRPPWRRRR